MLEATYTTPFKARFKASYVNGRYYTDGGQEISCSEYEKYNSFTENEVQTILKEKQELEDRLKRIENKIKAILQ